MPKGGVAFALWYETAMIHSVAQIFPRSPGTALTGRSCFHHPSSPEKKKEE
jgi:hypothetical protein